MGLRMVLATMLVLALGCSAGPGTVCAPGTRRDCTCPVGTLGLQTCNNAGSGYSDCEGCAACPALRVMCASGCVDTDTDSNNCGGCDSACATGSSCVSGRCMTGCPSPNVMCGTRCLSVASDPANCGGCGVRCSPGQVCTSSRCMSVGCSPACTRGFRCNASLVCELDPASQWVVAAVSGTVAERNCSGSAWDPLGGLPDPWFCMDVSGTRYCTSSIADTLSPNWGGMAFPAMSATTLLAGVNVSYEDVDTTTNDVICSGPFPFPAQAFRDGGGTLACGPCDNGTVPGTVRYTLTPQ